MNHRSVATFISVSYTHLSVVIILILLAVIIAIYLNNDFKAKTNELLLSYLPYFVFIMYLLNRGTTVTQAMFMNCDHSMLTYRIYRTPKVILGIFKERLKTLIKINCLPAFLLSLIHIYKLIREKGLSTQKFHINMIKIKDVSYTHLS